MLLFARLYVDEGRQLLVINSHADYDHCWGNQLFVGPQAVQPAPIIGSRLCAEQFRQPEAASYLKERQAKEPDIFGQVVLAPPTLRFDGQMSIDGGDLTLELFPTPGHTPDHIAIYIPEIKLLLAADGAEVPFPFARTVEGLPLMRQSLARMAALDPAAALYCHAPVTIGPQLLYDNIAYFNRVEEHCRAALARGVPAKPDEGEDVAGLVGLSFEEAIPTGEHWQDIDRFYREEGHAMQIRMMLEYLALLLTNG
jgi:glyoxylase-like metal-dependent hydrolase (beta-lactamase superfamily II)